MKNRNNRKVSHIRIVTFLIMVSIWSLSSISPLRAQTTQEDKSLITLKVTNQELGKVLEEIKSQTAYTFFFNAELETVRVSANLTKRDISTTLNALLKDTGIEYKVSGNSVWLTRSDKTEQQEDKTKLIRGVVTDDKGEALIGVHISSLSDPSVNTITNYDGEFELHAIEGSDLRFSYVSFEPQIAKANARTNMKITMKSDVLNLDEVVVIGYGTLKRSAVTSSITSVKADDFVKGPVTGAEQLLRGKVAGLSINTTSGDPNNQGVQIMLRGVSNLSGNQSPLVVIDGIPGGDLNLIAPEDVESIDILKDGSAAAIYGTRGTNGVIIVTTKKGSQSSGKISVDYHGYAMYEMISNKINMFSADGFRNIPELTEGKVLSKMTDGGANVNWFDEISRNPFSHVHNLSIRKGDAASNFIANVNYRDQDGILSGSERQQLNARLGVNHAILENRLRFSMNVNNTSATYQEAGGGIYFNSLLTNPTFPIKDDNGSYTVFQDAVNPVQEVKEKTNDGKQNIFMINGKVTAEPIKGLNISVLAGLQRNNTTTGSYATSQYVNGSIMNGEAWRNTGMTDLRTIETTIDYNFTVNSIHDFSVLAGHSYQKHTQEGFGLYNYNFPSDLLGYNTPQYGLALKEGSASMNGYKWQSQLASFFGRINYSLKNKYLLSASLRYEGSSKFGPNNKWGVFPAVSAGWRIKQEEFMKDVTFINDLKLRVGYGVTGAEPANAYLSINQYSFGDPVLSDGKWIWTVGPYKNANPDLKWETKHEFNVGLDFALFRGKLTGNFDYYNRTTRDLLYIYNVPVPPNLVSTIWANVGTVSNSGVELFLASNLVNTKDIRFRLSGNFSYNTNKVKKLSNDLYQRDFLEVGETGHPVQKATHLVKEGDPVGNLWGWKSVGLSEGGKSWLVETSDGGIGEYGNEADRMVLGNGIPKIFTGLTASLGYKNFDFEISLRGAFMFEILNKYRMLWETFNRGPQFNYPKTVLDKPYGSEDYVSANPSYVSYYVEKGNYMKIDNASIGYTIPLKSTQYVKKMRVYFSGLNLYTFTGYKGIDPEVNIMGLSPGIDDIWNLYPTTRSFSLGFQISL